MGIVRASDDSCNNAVASSPGSPDGPPARPYAVVRHAVRQRRTGMPSRWKTSGLVGSGRAPLKVTLMRSATGRRSPSEGHCQVDENSVESPPEGIAISSEREHNTADRKLVPREDVGT